MHRGIIVPGVPDSARRASAVPAARTTATADAASPPYGLRPAYTASPVGTAPRTAPRLLSNGTLGSTSSRAGRKEVWIIEGFARYAQWLWSGREGEGTAQELADHVYASHPADDPFRTVKPGAPEPENQFHSAVYDRGTPAEGAPPPARRSTVGACAGCAREPVGAAGRTKEPDVRDVAITEAPSVPGCGRPGPRACPVPCRVPGRPTRWVTSCGPLASRPSGAVTAACRPAVCPVPCRLLGGPPRDEPKTVLRTAPTGRGAGGLDVAFSGPLRTGTGPSRHAQSPWSYTVTGIPRRTRLSVIRGSTRDHFPPASPQPMRGM